MTDQVLERTAPGDIYRNYCWWPYDPVAQTQGKLRPASLLLASFEAAGIGPRAVELVRTIRAAIGAFRTVYGVKWLPAGYSAGGGTGGTLAWEFYFYDYDRRERQVSATRVLRAIRHMLDCPVQVNERLPYFMFSLDVTDAILASGRLDVVHLYIGNPGSRVSSGIAYAVRPTSTTLENFYFFFDAKRDIEEASAKVLCSAHVDATRVGVEKILWPELKDCQTLCIANKQANDTAYFAGINVDQLLFFLKRLSYPPALVGFIEGRRGELDHLLYDAGFDFVGDGDGIRIVKSGFYGIF